MKKWMQFPRTEGETSYQAHTNMPGGTFEREMGKEGFFGPATHFYHTHAPTGWSSFDGPLRPHAFDFGKAKQDGSSPWKAKTMLHNASCKIAMWSTEKAMDHLVRNGDGDWILFIHNGEGDFFCDFGHMPYRDGDYIVVPRSTMWRIEPKAKTDILMIEAVNDSFMLPDRGMLGNHALFDPAVLESPKMNATFKAQQTKPGKDDPWTVMVKRRDAFSTISYPFNPLDAIGWKGDLLVVKLNWRDIRPVISHSYHLPPSVHTTFVSRRFVVCTFVPRPMESAPEALKLPFYHNNDDFDEFLFYHRGDFMSRDNIHEGMTTLHPCGFTHGPHPKAFARAEANAGKMTNEVAVMIDTRDALEITDEARAVEWDDYVKSWGGYTAKAAE